MTTPSDSENTALPEDNRSNPVLRLRLWPAIVLVLLQVAVSYAFAGLGSTNIQSVVGLAVVPLFGTILLLLWWLAASRAPFRDRLLGLAVLVAALACIVFSQERNGEMLLVYAVPAMTIGAVFLLAITVRLRWPARRWIVLAFVAACTGLFSALRADTVGGNLAPLVSWRWSPSEAERSAALPLAEVHETAALPAAAGPGDWPAFRGPARDGRLTGVSFSTDWSTPPRELWRRKIGPAWSSFTAVGDFLFTQEQRGGDELVTCYRAATGEPVWVNRVAARFEDTMGLGPRATPTFDQGNLYTQGATGVLQCLDASTGNTIWKRDLAKDADTKVPGYGFSSSPLIVGNRVIEFTCGHEGKNAIAYDCATGEVAWTGGHGASAYTSPHLAVIRGVPQVLMVSDFGLQAFVPETGAPLWEHPWKVKTNPRCIQPLVVDGEAVMFGATGVSGSRLIRVEQAGASWNLEEVWTNKRFRPYFNDGVLHKGHYYGFDGDRLDCIDIQTGERRWEGTRYGGQLLLIADLNLLLILSETGDLALVQAVPEHFMEIARFNALPGKTWNHPVIAHGKLFVRNAEEAACYELKPPTNPA